MPFCQAWCAWSVHAVYIVLLQRFLLCVRIVACIASFAFWLKSGYLLLLIAFHLAAICNTMDLCADGLADAAEMFSPIEKNGFRMGQKARKKKNQKQKEKKHAISSCRRSSFGQKMFSRIGKTGFQMGQKARKKKNKKQKKMNTKTAPMIDTKSSLVISSAIPWLVVSLLAVHLRGSVSSAIACNSVARQWRDEVYNDNWFPESNTLRFSPRWRRIMRSVIVEWSAAADDVSDITASSMPSLVDSSSVASGDSASSSASF